MAYRSILTVTAAAADYMLTDLATAKDELNITDSSQDTRLTRWIKEASAAIQGPQGIGRVLRQETVSESFRSSTYQLDAPGEHFYPRIVMGGYGFGANDDVIPGLRLRRYPVASVTSIIEDGNTLDPNLPDYEIDGAPGIVYRLTGSSRIPWYGASVVVVYVGGYSSGNVPFDLQEACLLLLKHRKASQTRDPMLRQSSIPGVSESQYWVPSSNEAGALPPEVLSKILPYRDSHV